MSEGLRRGCERVAFMAERLHTVACGEAAEMESVALSIKLTCNFFVKAMRADVVGNEGVDGSGWQRSEVDRAQAAEDSTAE